MNPVAATYSQVLPKGQPQQEPLGGFNPPPPPGFGHTPRYITRLFLGFPQTAQGRNIPNPLGHHT